MYKTIVRGNVNISNIVKNIDLNESIDTIAYTANIDIALPDDFKLSKGEPIDIIKTSNGNKIFEGMIWDISIDEKNIKNSNLECKERTKYIEESEEEYMFEGGTTATQRGKRICRDWGIPIGDFSDTKVKLSKTAPKVDTIYGIMLDDIKETAQKGGGLFKYRMTNKLDLIELGSNEIVYDITSTLDGANNSEGLEGAISRVKVLGKGEDNKKSPVIGVFQKNVTKIGTLQKIRQDERVTDINTARNQANALFSDGKKEETTNGIDIPEIRAGDKVKKDGKYKYVTDVSHKLGTPGRMDLTLSTLEDIRRKYYADTE